VPLLMDHMGYREWVSDAIEVARDNPNVYLGTTIAAFTAPRSRPWCAHQVRARSRVKPLVFPAVP
jgi:hypothetical protein